MNTTICDAIRGRCILELRYHGYTRIVAPHAYGRDRSGEEILRCYQTSGGSESGETVGWKLLKVAEADAVSQLKQQFRTRPEYRQNDKAMQYVFCQLQREP